MNRERVCVRSWNKIFSSQVLNRFCKERRIYPTTFNFSLKRFPLTSERSVVPLRNPDLAVHELRCQTTLRGISNHTNT